MMLTLNPLKLTLFFGVIGCLLLNLEANAQKLPKPPTSPIVKGQIIDKDASPIPGATIIVKGTTTGTASDLNGFFELDLTKFTEKKVTLVMRYIGTEVKEVDVVLKDLPKSYGQIKLNDAVLQD
ncbi:carboxypeptidase-like regulatory domain-containing protein [Algoriphagus sp.]|uniref:carboxypeptidase-like regulatory domain-containing protein n=1 Tax=Algoriphagus sp. TaxID=1872435 RepID=UPI0025CC2785|nr:carboxypeptidase-like regulatory domain-containing protein [Algoriphagus sp.]